MSKSTVELNTVSTKLRMLVTLQVSITTLTAICLQETAPNPGNDVWTSSKALSQSSSPQRGRGGAAGVSAGLTAPVPSGGCQAPGDPSGNKRSQVLDVPLGLSIATLTFVGHFMFVRFGCCVGWSDHERKYSFISYSESLKKHTDWPLMQVQRCMEVQYRTVYWWVNFQFLRPITAIVKVICLVGKSQVIP